MNQLPMFFEQIMGIIKPWYIKEIKQEGMDIHITVDFEVGSRFEYGGEKCSVHNSTCTESQNKRRRETGRSAVGKKRKWVYTVV